jgi:hypothetical protein
VAGAMIVYQIFAKVFAGDYLAIGRNKMADHQSAGCTHSAIYRGLCELCEDLTMQSCLVAQITPANCEQWQQGVIAESFCVGTSPQDYDVASLHRFLKKPDIACSQFYLSFVHYYILRVVSVLELYLKDSLKQFMKLNTQLFKKGFNKDEKGNWEVRGLPKNLASKYSEETYLKYLNAIASHHSKGVKWSCKFKRYSKFLCILPEGEVSDKLDSLFKLRNDIAHLNRNRCCLTSLITESGFVFNRETILDNVKYSEVMTHIISIMNDAICLLGEADLQVHKKWPMHIQNPKEAFSKVINCLQ